MNLGDIPEGSNVSWAPWNEKEIWEDTYDINYTCFVSKVFSIPKVDGNPDYDWKNFSNEPDLDTCLIEASNLAYNVLDYLKEPTEQKVKDLKILANKVKENCSDWTIQDIEIEKV